MPIDELGLVERAGLDATEIDMIRHGDMIGQTLGAKVLAAIDRLDHECQTSMATIASERARAEAAEAKIERLLAGLTAISAIRDSIIGFQNVGWSEHIYPLVAALHDAGFEGVGYDEARKNVSRTIDALAAAEAQRDKLIEALQDAYALLLAPAEDIKEGVLSRARQALQDTKP